MHCIALQQKTENPDSLFTLIEFFSNNGIIFVKPSGLNYGEICLTYSSFIGFWFINRCSYNNSN